MEREETRGGQSWVWQEAIWVHSCSPIHGGTWASNVIISNLSSFSCTTGQRSYHIESLRLNELMQVECVIKAWDKLAIKGDDKDRVRIKMHQIEGKDNLVW